MSEMVITEKSDLVAIADAIREQTGETEGMKITAMPPKIRSIVGGGSGGGINVTGATKGQMIIVKDVDSDGKPTAWEAVDRLAWSESEMTDTLTWDGDLTGKKYIDASQGQDDGVSVLLVKIADEHSISSTNELLGGYITCSVDGSDKIIELSTDHIMDLTQEGMPAIMISVPISDVDSAEVWVLLEDFNFAGMELERSVYFQKVEASTAGWFVKALKLTSPVFNSEVIHPIDPKYYERLAWVEGNNKVPLDIISDPNKALSTMDIGEGMLLLRMSDDVLTLDELLQCYGQVVNTSENFEQTMSFAEAYEAGMITEMPGLITAQEIVIMVTDVVAANSLGLPFTFDHVGIYMAYMEGVTIRLYSDTVMMGEEIVHTIDPKYLPKGIGMPDMAAAEGEDGHIRNRIIYQEYVDVEVLAETTAEVAAGGYLNYTSNEIVVPGSLVTVTWNGVVYKRTAVDTGFATCIGNFGAFDSDEPNTGEPFLILFGDNGSIVIVSVDGGTITLSIAAHLLRYNKLPLDYFPDAYTFPCDIYNLPDNYRSLLNDEAFAMANRYLNLGLAVYAMVRGNKVRVTSASLDGIDYMWWISYESGGETKQISYTGGRLHENIVHRYLQADTTTTPKNGQMLVVAGLSVIGNQTYIGQVRPVDIPKAASVADAAGDTPTAAEFNALLAALRNAGLMA